MLLLALFALAGTPAPEPAPRGEIVPKVVCAADAEESYAVYLPSGYEPEKPSPILYLLDARRRGAMAAGRFREAAERYGWILASSNNSESDGPFAPNIRAMRAMWEDTHRRFSIDPGRVYASGFSGGARAACLLAQTAAKSRVAGVIGCGAGFADNAPPGKDLPFVYFGAVGNRDFNYREMRKLDATLASLGATHRLAVFDGPHDWPPPAFCTRAVEWMELAAMRAGARPRDPALVSEWLERALREAAPRETAGEKGAALERFREVGADFDGLADVSRIRTALERLERDPDALREIERQTRLEQREDVTFGELSQKLLADLASEDPVPPQRVAQDLRLCALRRNAESGSTEAERLSARRILAALFVQTSFYLPREYLERRDSRRANLCAAVAAHVAPERAALVLYNFACLQARLGEKTGALATLRTAVAKGFRDVSLIETDPDLASVRGEEGYRRIVEELKRNGSPPS